MAVGVTFAPYGTPSQHYIAPGFPTAPSPVYTSHLYCTLVWFALHGSHTPHPFPPAFGQQQAPHNRGYLPPHTHTCSGGVGPVEHMDGPVR